MKRMDRHSSGVFTLCVVALLLLPEFAAGKGGNTLQKSAATPSGGVKTNNALNTLVAFRWSARSGEPLAAEYRVLVRDLESTESTRNTAASGEAGEWRVESDRERGQERITDLQRYAGGYPVYGEQLRLFRDEQGGLQSLIAERSALSVVDCSPKFDLDASAAVQRALDVLGANASPPLNQRTSQRVYAGEQVWRSVWVVELDLGREGSSWHLVLDAITGEPLVCRELRCDAKQLTKVFHPDPITTSRDQYGKNGFVDDDDATNDALNRERVLVTLEHLAYDEDLSGWVTTGPYVKTVDLPGGPIVDRAVIRGYSEYFTRAEDGFEEVMAYYHLDRVQRRLRGYGIYDLQPHPIQVDAHYSVEDNSFYEAFSNGLYFGTGGVDDAEDAEVIVHEYGHALHFDALYNISGGGGYSDMSDDVAAFSEGFGDYLAVSHTVQISGVLDARVFNWDGHNEYWPGRLITTDETYDDWANDDDIYRQGTIFANALWLALQQLGPDITDQVVLTGLSHHLRLSTIKQVAEGMLEAADAVYPDQPHVYEVFRAALAEKGFVNTVSVGEARPGTGALPAQFSLTAAYPNPFNPSTALTASLAKPAELRLTVYDPLGRRVAKIDYGQLGAGTHRIVWQAPGTLASGLYLMRVEALGVGSATKRVLLVR